MEENNLFNESHFQHQKVDGEEFVCGVLSVLSNDRIPLDPYFSETCEDNIVRSWKEKRSFDYYKSITL